MADTAKLTIVKSFSYRGSPEEWSNTYHFKVGGDPATLNTAIDSLASQERQCFHTGVSWIRGYGYDVGSTTADTVHELGEVGDLVGTLDLTGVAHGLMPGDVAATVAWKTADFTTGTRPKRIYLRKYYHGVFGQGSGGDTEDELLAEQAAAFSTMAAAIAAPDPFGIGDYCGPRGASAIDSGLVSPFLTTRTLKRRGRRPPT